MAMGARFNPELEWEGNDLEVCGPGLFDNGVTITADEAVMQKGQDTVQLNGNVKMTMAPQ